MGRINRYISALKNKIAGARPTMAASLFIFALAVVILGTFPCRHAFWAKCWTAEWVLIIFLSLVFFKDKWLKAFLIICLFNFIRTFSLGGVYKGTAFVALYYTFLFLVVYQVLLNKLKKEDSILIINGICIIVLIQLAYMYLQYFKIDPIFKLGEPYASGASLTATNLVTASWGHTNISGASLAITLPLFFRRKWCLAIPPILLMLWFAQSLGAIVAAASGGLFYLFFTKNLFIPRRYIIVIMVFVIGAVFTYGRVVEDHQFSLTNDRVGLLRTTLSMIKHHPIIGYGLGQYKLAFGQRGAVYVFKKGQKTSHAHFDLAEATVDIGLIGTFVILGFLTSLMVYFLKNRTSLSVLAMSAAAAALVNSCSTFVFHTPLAWIFLILIVLVKKEGGKRYVNQIYRP